MKYYYTGVRLSVSVLLLWMALISCEPVKETITAGEVKELVFAMPDSVSEGQYYFDFDNGKEADYPLCFCLTVNNSFPPECIGDIEYVSHNSRSITAVPVTIGNGSCAVRPVKTGMYATIITVGKKYRNRQIKDSIYIGIKIPDTIAGGERISFILNFYKKSGMNSELIAHSALLKRLIVK